MRFITFPQSVRSKINGPENRQGAKNAKDYDFISISDQLPGK